MVLCRREFQGDVGSSAELGPVQRLKFEVPQDAEPVILTAAKQNDEYVRLSPENEHASNILLPSQTCAAKIFWGRVKNFFWGRGEVENFLKPKKIAKTTYFLQKIVVGIRRWGDDRLGEGCHASPPPR